MTIERALELLPQMRDSEWITALGKKTALYTDEAKEAFNLAISALEQQEQVNTQSVNSTHTKYPNALESLKILESAKDENGCVPMSLVRLAFRNVLEQDRWIPVAVRPPETTDPVNVTWANNDPVSYYEDIRGKRFTATACYHKGKWWWYSAVCQDLLDEYGKSCMDDEIDEAIEILAWRPLPELYTEDEDEEQKSSN